MEPERLGGANVVHVGRQPARVYRDALRARGVTLDATAPAARERLAPDAFGELEPILVASKLDEWASVQALERLISGAECVERQAEPELWTVTDGHGLRVSARVIRWRAHVWVVGLTVRDAEGETLDAATWTAAALEQYARSRGLPLERAQAELRIALHLAEPVDVARQPEKWRARSRLDDLDVTLAVNVVDRAGARLVVAAEGRKGKSRR